MVHMAQSAQPPTSGCRAGRVRHRLRTALVAVLTTVVLATACTDGTATPEAAPAPTGTVPPIEAPTQLPDTRGVVLAGVAGAVPPPAPIEIRGGDADIVGTVTGPDGPAADAFVLLERFVGEQRASLTVRSDGQGRFRVLQVHGGRYRFRAWQAPDLALTIPELRFVRDDGEVGLDLVLSRHDGLSVQAVVDTSTPLVDQSVTVTALVTRQRVDEQGIVSALPASDEDVVLDADSGWRVSGSANQTIGVDGRASWTVTCVVAGSGRLEVRAAGEVATISTGCQLPPEEPEEPEGDPPPDPDFAVGNRFSPPFAPALPAGRYEVVESPGSCGISFERYSAGVWEDGRQTATGTVGFDVSTPFRDVRVIGDSPPCRYERVS